MNHADERGDEDNGGEWGSGNGTSASEEEDHAKPELSNGYQPPEVACPYTATRIDESLTLVFESLSNRIEGISVSSLAHHNASREAIEGHETSLAALSQEIRDLRTGLRRQSVLTTTWRPEAESQDSEIPALNGVGLDEGMDQMRLGGHPSHGL